MKKLLLLFVLVLSASLALATEPGHPLDCSDWVFVDEGLSCEVWIADPACGSWTNLDPACDTTPERTRDNQSGRLTIESSEIGVCGGTPMRRSELVRYHRGSRELLAYIEERCASMSPARIDGFRVRSGPLFDEEEGAIRILFQSHCVGDGCYGDQLSVYSIRGFATEFEIMQSYNPSLDQWSFRVPVLPEGLQYAGWFDTYWGWLDKPLDFGEAKALQCEYPATPPAIGALMSFADAAPRPTPGRAVYYLTRVNTEGTLRSGRLATTGGTLRGRDALVLPPCVPE